MAVSITATQVYSYPSTCVCGTFSNGEDAINVKTIRH